MPYTALTDTSSKQYQLQQRAYTDEQGFRRIGNDYMVAMGTYYTETYGTRFKITLDTDTVFTVIVGDIKADIHTDKLGQYTPIYEGKKLILANILEFIVDINTMDRDVLSAGTICNLGFEGDIVKIEKLVEE